jgi:hypothetical protein
MPRSRLFVPAVALSLAVVGGIALFLRRRRFRQRVLSVPSASVDVPWCVKNETTLDNEFVARNHQVRWSCPGVLKRRYEFFSDDISTFFELFFVRCLTAVHRNSSSSQDVCMPWIPEMWLCADQLAEIDTRPRNVRCRANQLELVDLSTGVTVPFVREPAFQSYTDVLDLILPHFATLTRRGRSLPRDGDEFVMLKGLISSSMSSSEIVRIHKIHNAALWQAFDSYRRRVASKRSADKTLPLPLTCKLLFHCTDLYAAASVVEQGFDTKYAGRSNGTAYGHGIYFATEAQLAASYAVKFCKNHLALLCCRVVIGTCSELVTSAADDSAHAVVDSLAKPELYVIQNTTLVYPLYVAYVRL